MQYYVVDTTITPSQEKWFNTYPDIVRYLESMTQRAYRQSRKQRMLVLEDLGHGYDDTDSVNFVRSMQAQFNIGVLRDAVDENQKMRCDITSIALFQKDEFGS